MVSTRSAALVLLVLALVIGGCSSLTDAPGTDDPAGTATATPIPIDDPTLTPTPTPNPGANPVTDVTADSNLDENQRPTELELANNRDETAAVTISITRAEAETVFEKTYHLGPGEGHDVVLDYRANYTVTVTVGNFTATKRIPTSMFDCNDYRTTFAVFEDEILVRTLSTAKACPTASPE